MIRGLLKIHLEEVDRLAGSFGQGIVDAEFRSVLRVCDASQGRYTQVEIRAGWYEEPIHRHRRN